MADIASSSAAKHSSLSNINHLFDDTLTEILIRLSCRSTAICKCVCKRWLKLISSPCFSTQLVSHQHSLLKAFFTLLSPHQLTFTFLPKDFDFNSQTNKTIFSPKILVKGNVCGYDNGLFLCCSNRYTSGQGYFVYDPLTKECTHIPPLPEAREESFYAVGFLSRTENSTRTFCVILINSFERRMYEFKVEVFFSERGVWTQKLSRCREGFVFAPHWMLGLAQGRNLYFMGRTNIFVVDCVFPHYNIIDYPQGANAMNIMSFGYLGCSAGTLKIADIYNNDLRVWKLTWKGEGTTIINLYQTWELVQMTNLSAYLPAKFCDNNSKRVAGFHPLEEDIVYLHSYVDGVFIGNLRTNKFEHVPGYEKFDISPFQFEFPAPFPIPSSNVHVVHQECLCCAPEALRFPPHL